MRRLLPLLLCLWAGAARAEVAAFDLPGPALRVLVTRGGQTLPVAQVPDLLPGDRLEVAPLLPADQGARYRLVVAFLRGATNPPPDGWFTQMPAWGRARTLRVQVPADATGAVLFLAPATGGDVQTLRAAVRARPGAFVRAAQALNQASLDRARLDAFVAGLAAGAAPAGLAHRLDVTADADCLRRRPGLQAACLGRGGDALVAGDGRGGTLGAAVAGPGADLALQFSATPQGGLGAYSPYIAAVRDIIGILGSLRTAHYQYLPAITQAHDARLQLVLNGVPSFRNPKSVLVASLPPVGVVAAPALPAAAETLCAAPPTALLPLAADPVIYATGFAHDLAVRIAPAGGAAQDLPAVADAVRGGLVVTLAGMPAAGATGRLIGRWGFAPLAGPAVTLVPPRAGGWRAELATAGGVVLAGGVAACVQGVGGADGHPLAWQRLGADTIRVTLPAGQPAPVVLAVTEPDGPTTVALPRPQGPAVTATAQLVAPPPAPPLAPGAALRLVGDRLLPADGTLALVVRATAKARFSGRESVELRAATGVPVALPPGTAVLADRATLVARVRPDRLLGPSAFGPLGVRVVADGVAGPWVELGMLVRLPRLDPPVCGADGGCVLAGDRLFLLAAVAATPDFQVPLLVPDGDPGDRLPVPHPLAGRLFARLRDDPAALLEIGG